MCTVHVLVNDTIWCLQKTVLFFHPCRSATAVEKKYKKCKVVSSYHPDDMVDNIKVDNEFSYNVHNQGWATFFLVAV